MSPAGEWCEHCKIFDEHGHEAIEYRVNGLDSVPISKTYCWNFCPVCGAKRPEPKFMPSAKLEESTGDLIIYGKNKAWRFDGIAFRRIVNDPEPEKPRTLAERLQERWGRLFHVRKPMDALEAEALAAEAVDWAVGVVDQCRNQASEGFTKIIYADELKQKLRDGAG